MTDHSVPSPSDPGQIPPSVRAQLLATEHWSLLASRSTTQAEVLTRISIFLTLTVILRMMDRRLERVWAGYEPRFPSPDAPRLP